jgi:hypothetical protein
MIYIWAIILVITLVSGMVYGLHQMRVRTRERILSTVKKQDGPEAAKAMEDHLKGEW